jgi:predicted GIY-YIG superfamily endonuclease
MSGNYHGALIKTRFKCECSFEWDSTPGNILSGKGCPVCASYGFNQNKDGYSYIIMFETFVKFGITNDINRRLREHTKMNGKYDIVKIKKMSGSDAIKWERFIKTHYKGNYVSKDICPDGWTETLPLSLVDDITITLV